MCLFEFNFLSFFLCFIELPLLKTHQYEVKGWRDLRNIMILDTYLNNNNKNKRWVKQETSVSVTQTYVSIRQGGES